MQTREASYRFISVILCWVEYRGLQRAMAMISTPINVDDVPQLIYPRNGS